MTLDFDSSLMIKKRITFLTTFWALIQIQIKTWNQSNVERDSLKLREKLAIKLQLGVYTDFKFKVKSHVLDSLLKK